MIQWKLQCELQTFRSLDTSIVEKCRSYVTYKKFEDSAKCGALIVPLQILCSGLDPENLARVRYFDVLGERGIFLSIIWFSLPETLSIDDLQGAYFDSLISS